MWSLRHGTQIVELINFNMIQTDLTFTNFAIYESEILKPSDSLKIAFFIMNCKYRSGNSISTKFLKYV